MATDQVNTLVGNAGYVAATGHAPTTVTNDDARVRAHLAFAERRLRQSPAAGLSPALAARRAHLLDLLHRYWVAGVFPRNYDFPGERRPCFIDRDGRLCAVGFLVAETAGRAAAERINAAHQYELIADMRTPALGQWVRHSGLTKVECALIQPSYGAPVNTPAPVPVPVPTSYAVGSAVWGGVNVMLAAANASQLNQTGVGRGVAYAGVLSGTGQVLLGALRLRDDEAGTGYYIGWNPPAGKSHAAERTVSYVNIGAGTATLALGFWNLLHHRPAGAGRTAVGVVNYNGSGSGLVLTRRF
ncbi:hypothetical protein GCM10022407_04580 [Hymenobacter antarcticus]|uniref:Uncharacterized protein n=1 Tax=Hymenobacter antarcticus TaxID=486270 RepID=A0ABP7P741_9BACT